MNNLSESLHRRGFLQRAGGLVAGITGTMLLSGCGGGSTDAAEAVQVVAGPAAALASASTAGVAAADVAPLNLALNIAYVGAQFFGYGANGRGLPGSMLGGVGRQGGVTGARQVAFADAGTSRFAAELAGDKLAHVTGLRGLLGAAAAAQPGLDFAAGASAAAHAAGIAGPGGAFDPFASDDEFLLGALFVEDGVAAAYRSLLAGVTGDASVQQLTAMLADAIYHGGLVRTLLAGRGAADPALATSVAAICAALARIDGSDTGDQSLAADGSSANLPDANGLPIPFTRNTAQVLRTLYLSPAAASGGFVPYGVNAVPS